MPQRIPNTKIEVLKTNTKKVLLIDDDEDQLFVISMMLEQPGVEVVSMRHNQLNIDELQLAEYSCIIADVMMPGGGGQEVLRKLRARNADVPIIMTSAGREDLKQDLLQAGASAFCLKYDPAKSLYNEVSKICTLAYKHDKYLHGDYPSALEQHPGLDIKS